LVQKAAKQEVIRRYFRYHCEYILGFVNKVTVMRVEEILDRVGVTPEDRQVVIPARKAAEICEKEGKGNAGVYCGAAVQLKDGRIVTGKNSPLMHASSSLILNTIKILAEIPDRIHLLSPNIISSISTLERDILEEKAVSLNLNETLVALSISAATNPTAQFAMEKLVDLKDCDVHLTHIPSPGDEVGLRRLKVNLTTDPQFAMKSLFEC
jgi:uncharacterized protein (UPF0371 family)